MAQATKSENRLLYLDWVRGLAAAVMLQGHVFHSFMRDDLRNSGPYLYSQFLGGMPPAAFLFLTGMTLAFLMHSMERKKVSIGSRWVTSLRRAGYLFVIAFAFRIQSWLFAHWFGAPNPWTEILKVDILNCMGFSMAVLSIMVLFTTAERVRLAAVLGCAIAFLSPLVAQLNPSLMPGLLRDYLVPSANFFGFFPWAAFIAFGLSFGSLIRIASQDHINAVMQWAGIAGIVLAFGSQAISSAGPAVYANSNYWIDGPTLIFIKLGVMLIAIALAYVWTLQPSAQGWSWMRTLGTNSLLVYWVHIELVYGRWMAFAKNSLTVPEVMLASVLMIGAMVGLAYVKCNWRVWRPAVMVYRAAIER